VGQEHHENVDIVHDWFHSLKLINLISCSLGSQQIEREEEGDCIECGSQSGEIPVTAFGIFTLDSPVEGGCATNKTHDRVDECKHSTFILHKLGDQEGKWNCEGNGESRGQVFVEVLLDWLSLHGITLRVDAHTDGRNNHVEEAKKENTHDSQSRHFKINFTGRNIFCSVVHSGSLLSRSKT
jgi:hypothetical protein